jgi:alpha-tubulin suppressor-like RCC1 family protein
VHSASATLSAVSPAAWTAVSAGGDHTCAINIDATLWCWGSNGNGQLGDGTTNYWANPTRAGSATYTAVSAGNNYTCGIQTGATLWCWGYSGSAQLGVGEHFQELSPTQVGSATYTAVSAGLNHTCAIQADATLWCWGNNSAGQLGDGGTSAGALSPTQVGSATYSDVSVGDSHTCAIKSDATLWCWGSNNFSQKGDGTSTNWSTPLPTQSSSTTFTAIDAGGQYTCAIKPGATLWCWGDNGDGQLGDGTTTPRTSARQVGSATYTAASASKDEAAYHTCAIKSDATLWCWGYNGKGQLGDGTTSQRLSPVQVGSATYIAVSAGRAHTCGIKSDATLWCWGHNASGQLGDWTTTQRFSPRQVGNAISGGALAFEQQPSGGVAGEAFPTQPVISVRGSDGATVISDNVTRVMLALTGPSGGGTLTCLDGLQKIVTTGVAGFTGCTVDVAKPGYAIRATAYPAWTATDSTTFTVVQGGESPSPTPSPTPTPVPKATSTPTPSPVPTPSPSATPTSTPTPAPSPSPNPGPSATQTPTPAPIVTLLPGINLITWPAADASIGAAVSSFPRLTLAVYEWDSQTGSWKRYFPGLPPFVNTLSLLRNGSAYWILAE